MVAAQSMSASHAHAWGMRAGRGDGGDRLVARRLSQSGRVAARRRNTATTSSRRSNVTSGRPPRPWAPCSLLLEVSLCLSAALLTGFRLRVSLDFTWIFEFYNYFKKLSFRNILGVSGYLGVLNIAKPLFSDSRFFC